MVARDQGSLYPSLTVLLPQPACHTVAMPGLVEGWLGVTPGQGRLGGILAATLSLDSLHGQQEGDCREGARRAFW